MNINICNIYMTKCGMTYKDCVFYKDNNKIKSAGFTINSPLLEQSVKHFSDLAIPPGLFYQPKINLFEPKCSDNQEIYNEALYNKLYKFVNKDVPGKNNNHTTTKKQNFKNITKLSKKRTTRRKQI